MLDPLHPGPDYVLRWPRELFTQEARSLAKMAPPPRFPLGSWVEDVELLLSEAFASSVPASDFSISLRAPSSWPELVAYSVGQASAFPQPRSPFLTALTSVAAQLPEEGSHQPYWAARHGQSASNREPRQDHAAVRRDWKQIVTELQGRGYLSQVAPDPCPDGDRDADPLQTLDVIIADRLGPHGLWSNKRPESWDDDTFYSLIEVMHDLVSRPRHRFYHDYSSCGWHYSDFARYPAEVLYRWTVNRVLARYGVELMLAKSGEDAGRLVHQPQDPRGALIEAAGSNAPPADHKAVEHAIALFRSRRAGREDKRSACIALAGVLETRRRLLEQELLSKDEGALFEIANKFDVRHRRADQRRDYDDAYLDWLFWWYLGTVELTNRLLDRQQTAGA